MSTLVRLFPCGRKPSPETASRLRVRVPHDETGPLVVTIPNPTAAYIRQAALWVGKHPDQFAIDWLRAGFLSSEQQA
jgi:hypothetical protein